MSGEKPTPVIDCEEVPEPIELSYVPLYNTVLKFSSGLIGAVRLLAFRLLNPVGGA